MKFYLDKIKMFKNSNKELFLNINTAYRGRDVMFDKIIASYTLRAVHSIPLKYIAKEMNTTTSTIIYRCKQFRNLKAHDKQFNQQLRKWNIT